MASYVSTTALTKAFRGNMQRIMRPLVISQMSGLHTAMPIQRTSMAIPSKPASAHMTDPVVEDVAQNLDTSEKINSHLESGYETIHFKSGTIPSQMEKEYTMPHPIWTNLECSDVHITHRKPSGIVDRMAYLSVQFFRRSFDFITAYGFKPMTEDRWLTRIIFLETVAGVPGMVAAMTRHLHSLRRMRRDHGWIHTLLEEAENERMHLLTALTMKNPGLLMRGAIVGTQGVVVTGFTLAYMISPRFCHRFVGYLEEEAVKTYTVCLEQIDSGRIWKDTPAPLIARNYWKLPNEANMRDLIAQIRADEAHHRVVNHNFSDLTVVERTTGIAVNPYGPGR